jgi:predicted O-methyltransferase YrrM
MSRSATFLTDDLYQYLLNVSVNEADILKELRQYTHTLTAAKMQLAPEQGQFLKFLISLLGAKRTLDVGVFTGYSSLVAALALPDDGEVIACDNDRRWTQIAEQFWHKAGVDHKIELRL